MCSCCGSAATMWSGLLSNGGGSGDDKAIEILIGSDPKRAPSQLNNGDIS